METKANDIDTITGLGVGSKSVLVECEHGYDACLMCDCDATDIDEPPLCGGCKGSGEGAYEGTRCLECNGRGQEMSP